MTAPMPNDSSPSSAGSDHAATGAPAARYQTGPVGEDGLCPVEDRTLGRKAVGHPVPADQAEALEREGRFFAKLNHAGMPMPLDLVREQDGALLVLRQVEGITLAEAMRRAGTGAIAPELADPVSVAQVMIKVGEALAAAHASGVVHRHLDPQAIVLGAHGQVVVQGWQGAIAETGRPLTARYMSAAASPRLDGLHEDVRALGACLFAALVWRVPEGADPLAGLTPEERQRVPAGLGAIIHRALGSDAVSGYGTLAAFAADLHRFLAGQALAAQAPDAPPQQGGSGLRFAIPLLAAACVAAAILLAPRLRTGTDWGAPVMVEDFSDGSWKSRWVEPPNFKGMFAVKDGQLVSIAERGADLIMKRRLTAPLAVEYTGEILPGSQPCDLGFTWCESLGVGEDPSRYRGGGGRSCAVYPGGYGNAGLVMEMSGHRLPVAYRNEPLEAGRRYRFRVEIEGNDVSLWVDGQEKLRYSDPCPFSSGYIALYAHFPGKAFDDITVYQKAPTSSFSQLSFGDVLLQPGKYEEAAAVYARIIETDPAGEIGQQALYRKGFAEWKRGEKDLAAETWSRVTDKGLRDQIACYTIEGQPAAWHLPGYFLKFAQAYQDNPQMRAGLRQTWQTILERLMADPRPDQAVVDSFLDLRVKLFPEDQSATYMATIMLISLGRYEQCLREFPNDRSASATALLALGRTREALATSWISGDARVKAWQMTGDLQQVVTAPGVIPILRVLAQCKLGKGDEIADDPEFRYPVLIHLGRAAQLLASRPLSPRAANDALLSLGRLEEAAGAGIPDIQGSGGDPIAMLLLGHLEEAETAAKHPFIPIRFMVAAEKGDAETLAQLHDQVVLPADARVHTGWFAPLIVRPLVDRWGGDADALEKQLRPQLERMTGIYGKRGWFLARAILGDTDAEAVMGMSAVSEAAAWRALAMGMREELAGHPAEARAAYSAFLALPWHQRLLALNQPDPEVEWFVAWRLRALP
jgi:tetratricopeptide (TPR) repeat protein